MPPSHSPAWARVTSVDISQRQLDVAADRARTLGLDLAFVRADATDVRALPHGSFDLVVSTNGFFVWIAEPAALFTAVHAVLMRGGVYVFYDIHPFQRPWADHRDALLAVCMSGSMLSATVSQALSILANGARAT